MNNVQKLDEGMDSPIDKGNQKLIQAAQEKGMGVPEYLDQMHREDSARIATAELPARLARGALLTPGLAFSLDHPTQEDVTEFDHTPKGVMA